MAEYIEREAAMTLPVLSTDKRHYQTNNLDDAYEQGWNDALECVSIIPAADVAPVVHAQWIEDRSGIIICPECKRGYNLHAKYTHYCPNCGAKMDGEP